MDYVLQFFSEPRLPHTVRMALGEFGFREEEDAAAVAFIRSEYARQIEEAPQAILWRVQDRHPVWVKVDA